MKMTFVNLSVLASVAFCSVAGAADLEAAKEAKHSTCNTNATAVMAHKDKAVSAMRVLRFSPTQHPLWRLSCKCAHRAI